MEIKNMTPHEIAVQTATGMKSIPSSGCIRVSSQSHSIGEIDGIQVSQTTYGKVTDLPEQEDGVIYIVSSIVCQAAPERNDLYIVNETIRDDSGRIIGCKSIAVNPYYRCTQ